MRCLEQIRGTCWARHVLFERRCAELGANGPYFQWGRGFVLPNFEASKGNSHDFLMGEVRYASLVQSFPEEVKKLHAQLEEEYKERWEGYKKMAGG